MPAFARLSYPAKLTLIFGVLAAGITVSEYLHYNGQKALIRHHQGDELCAIADLKARQISGWLAERLNDGRAQHEMPIREEVGRLLRGAPMPPGGRERLLGWMNGFKPLGYAETALLDTRGVVRLASMPDTNTIGSVATALALKAINTDDVVVSDLYRVTANHIGIDIAVPLGFSPTAPRAGALILRVNPADFLYPLIRGWPAANATAETLLLRREREQVLFLNELRHRKDTALLLRVPLANTVLTRVQTGAAAQAAEAKDYRGVSVLAAAREVPGTSWVLIAKKDLDEIYAPLRNVALTNVSIVLLLLAGAGAGATLLWRQQKRISAELRRASAYNRTLIEASLDPLVTIDAAGKITDVNTATEKITGQTRQQLIGSDFSDYFTDPQTARAGYMQVFRDGTVQDYALEVRHSDGRRTPVLYNASVYRDAAGRVAGVFAAARDITERKRADQALKRAQEQLHVATAAGSIGLWYWDIPNDDLYWSDECKALFGVSQRAGAHLRLF